MDRPRRGDLTKIVASIRLTLKTILLLGRRNHGWFWWSVHLVQFRIWYFFVLNYPPPFYTKPIPISWKHSALDVDCWIISRSVRIKSFFFVKTHIKHDVLIRQGSGVFFSIPMRSRKESEFRGLPKYLASHGVTGLRRPSPGNMGFWVRAFQSL